MSPFSILLARLVELLGAKAAAKLVREFAAQTIKFPATDHSGTAVLALVTKRMSIHYLGVEYSVSHLPHASVGNVITVNPASLLPLDQHHSFVAEPLGANNHAAEMNQTAADLQYQSLAHVQKCTWCRAEEAYLRRHAAALAAAESPATHGALASRPARETQSAAHQVDSVNVGRS